MNNMLVEIITQQQTGHINDPVYMIGEQLKEMAEADRKAAELQDKLNEAQKKLKTANPEIAAFKTLFDEMQKTSQALNEKLNKINSDSPEIAEKLLTALQTFGNNLQEIKLNAG